ncbi:MAG: mandelate racemase/muconate lactonizing enzyme family protein [Spirochaetaceae bacterium]|jgi:L-alanine-DL-glutamate epimerase-like enolase superfamily enzyme|nr:mandelate racemase/muconate lactonizing enzyme family protein [Spirochaetaceae bacterium]
MKITKIDIMQLNQGQPSRRSVILRIYTDEGIYGDGEAALAYGIGSTAAFGMIQDLAPLIIGDDPLAHEVIWNKLYKTTFWGQNGGPVTWAGISAIDIALWDIKGKFFNQPVYRLLGGKFRDDLRTYASQLQFGWGPEREAVGKTEDLAAVAKQVVAEGYDAVKIDFFTYDRDGRNFTTEEQTGLLSPYYLDLIEERVAAVREAVGPGVDIIAENHSKPDANGAVQIGNRIRKYNIFYFEEPNTPTPKLAKVIGDRIGIPIAHGERVYSRWQYAPYFENSSVQVIQPDLGNTGGITEAKKIADLAYTYDVSVQLHVCHSPLSTSAALHFEAAIPNFVIHEYHRASLIKTSQELCIYDPKPVKGRFAIPELPGLGNEWSEKALTENIKVTVREKN